MKHRHDPDGTRWPQTLRRTPKALVTLGLFFCAVAVAESILAAPIGDGSGEGTEPSPCLTDATIQFGFNPTSVAYGQPTNVSWSVHFPATGCSSAHVKLNGDPVANSGSRTVTPPASATYRLLISQTRGGVYQERTVTAQVAVTFPPRVVIDPSTVAPVAVLVGALRDPGNQIIELCDVDLDLTGFTDLVIGDGRSLIASPACARGPRSFGPRIFVTDRRGNSPLFVVAGDNVRVSGFRLEGPTSGIGEESIKEKGIIVAPPDGADPIRNIEISNMEIFHWSGLGIQVVDNATLAERGRLFNTNPGAVRVRDNFFHHNRHDDGDGYGVEVAAGGYATIERNVFDENRHGIAGGSRNDKALDYSGYTARDNLILTGGGLHCSEFFLFALCGWRCNCTHTHQIDMHGDQNEWYSSHNWECGTAGETMIIERNTILYTAGTAIKIRGNPADKAVVRNNVFKHDNRGDAIAQNGYCGFGDNITNPIIVEPDNVFKADPMKELGSCDFFGDGREDKFMATGVTWWALSPVTQQWRYLNTMTERWPELEVGKLDADAICDVFPRRSNPLVRPEKYSKSGTGPWVPLDVVHP